MTPTQGILYVATGEKYIRAACRSAISIHKVMPQMATHLFADWQSYSFNFDQSPYPFTEVVKILNPHRRSKVDYLSQTPFEETLYLDTDTTVQSDITEMFRLLERFDVGLCHAHWRSNPMTSRSWRVELPQAFPQYNSGVILYRKTAEAVRFMEEWRQSFKEADFRQDQITLRELLWESDLRIATLPPEYNVRFLKYPLLWSKTEARPKIYHLQMYHDGPFWFIKNWIKQFGRKILQVVRLSPMDVKNIFKK